MNLLLDTCVAVWATTDSARLSARARQALEEADAIHISAVSPWELILKAQGGKRAPRVPWDDLIRRPRIWPLPLAFDTYRRVESMPLHHADPFDRLLIAQALLHGLTLVTPDERIHTYDLPLIW